MADYSEIIAAIDAAVLAKAAFPITLSSGGKATTYRSLMELIEARKFYMELQSASGDIRDAIKISHFKPGGAY